MHKDDVGDTHNGSYYELILENKTSVQSWHKKAESHTFERITFANKKALVTAVVN